MYMYSFNITNGFLKININFFSVPSFWIREESLAYDARCATRKFITDCSHDYSVAITSYGSLRVGVQKKKKKSNECICDR